VFVRLFGLVTLAFGLAGAWWTLPLVISQPPWVERWPVLALLLPLFPMTMIVVGGLELLSGVPIRQQIDNFNDKPVWLRKLIAATVVTLLGGAFVGGLMLWRALG
jgi:hypothetical protein